MDLVEVAEGIRSVKEAISFTGLPTGVTAPSWKLSMNDGQVQIIKDGGVAVYTFPDLGSLAEGKEHVEKQLLID
ncbi:MAG: hypothetical protein H6765_06105 [Candidatus Peribacteria bacterium]|nr:MAG: hypothetical protein H6765_06105 [Candidatus Peribacteria bacterium]